MMSTVLETARQNNPGESGITLLLTLGIGAPYFQQEILQYLNLTDWGNLRLTNARHNMIVKPLRAMVMSRCKSRRYMGGFQSYPWTLAARWPLVGVGGRNLVDFPKALEVLQSNPGLACTVSWPHDKTKIQACTKLQGWLREKIFAGPCSEIVCWNCADSSEHLMRAGISAIKDKRFDMVMCLACQTHEMSRHPYGFRSCICEQNLGPVANGGWRCHNCLATAIYALLERATTKLNALEFLYRTPEGNIWWDTKANGVAEGWPLLYTEWPCPGCLARLPDTQPDGFWRPTVRFCAACDGIIVEATCGKQWRPSVLALTQPLLTSDPIMSRNKKKTPLTYAALDLEILSYKQGLKKLKISEVET